MAFGFFGWGGSSPLPRFGVAASFGPAF